jgi:hypothetical protein
MAEKIAGEKGKREKGEKGETQGPDDGLL